MNNDNHRNLTLCFNKAFNPHVPLQQHPWASVYNLATCYVMPFKSRNSDTPWKWLVHEYWGNWVREYRCVSLNGEKAYSTWAKWIFRSCMFHWTCSRVIYRVKGFWDMSLTDEVLVDWMARMVRVQFSRQDVCGWIHFFDHFEMQHPWFTNSLFSWCMH